VLEKPIESAGVIKYAVIWKVCTVFLVKISGNFPEIFPENFRKDLNKFPEISSGINFRTHNPSYDRHNKMYSY